MYSRIPAYAAINFDGVKLWFVGMAKEGLLFHPDDKPEDIVSIKTGDPIFTENECLTINSILDDMFNDFGNDVYEAAYPSFMAAIGIPH